MPSHSSSKSHRLHITLVFPVIREASSFLLRVGLQRDTLWPMSKTTKPLDPVAVFKRITTLLERLNEDDRRRVLSAISVFFAVG